MRDIISIDAPEGLDTEEVTDAKELVLNELSWPKNDTMIDEGDEESSIIHDQIGFADLVVTRLIESGWRPTHEIDGRCLAAHDSEVASKALREFADFIVERFGSVDPWGAIALDMHNHAARIARGEQA